MTSNLLSSNLKLLKESIRRQVSIITIYALVLFFLLPVGVALVMGSINSYSTAQSITSSFANYFRGINGMLVFFTTVGAFLSAMTVCFFMHSKKQVDFYHSLPVKRRDLFAINYFTGLLMPVVPYIFMLLCTFLLLAGSGYGAYVNYGAVLIGAAQAILFYAMSFSVVMLCGVLCGHPVIQMLLGAIALGIGPFLVLCHQGYMQTFYRTFYYDSAFYTNLYSYTSPVGRYIVLVSNNISLSALEFGLSVVLICALYALGVFAYSRRPSEGADKALVFNRTRPVIKYLVVFCATLAGGIVFHNIGNYSPGYGWMIFGFICGAVISHLIIEIIYAFDFRNIFKNIGGLAVYMLCFGVFITVPMLDLTGYDSFVPNLDSVKSATVHLYDVDSFATINYDTWETGNSYSRSISGDPYLKNVLKDPDNIKALVALSEIHRDNYEKNDIRSSTYQSAVISFKMKNGTTKMRRYFALPKEESMSYIDTVLNSDEYKLARHFILTLDPAQIGYCAIYALPEIQGRLSPDFSDQQISQIVEAYRKDFLTLSADDMRSTTPLFTISFVHKNTVARYNTEGNEGVASRVERGARYFGGWNEIITYPIYDSFENTITLLEGMGIDMSDPYGLSMVDYMEIVEGSYSDYSEKYYDYKSPAMAETTRAQPMYKEAYAVRIENPDEIRQVLYDAFPADYMHSYSSLLSADPIFYITVHYKDGSHEYTQSYRFIEGQISDAVKDLIDYDAAKARYEESLIIADQY